ncbi:AEC family transporter [Neptunomonas japonica]|uniref:AEC family transporter n=1 Tax=Neptunomonas japonica JAMM 1380 TaxID=1441457 RepID=A0A7R6SX61_9GAMM|nr:AEC family transporter [Neptunomonas japonica]BBB31156.1 AEC family transporter [Neptunomonas japonica JAMM 1380]
MALYLDTLVFTANIVAPIFFIVFMGVILKRTSLIDEAFVSTGSKLVFIITLPTLVFMSIARTDFQAVFNPAQLSYVAAGTLITFIAIWLLAKQWIHKPEDLGVFIQGSFRSNYGIIGLAVSFNLFGQTGLAQASLLLALVIPLYNVLSIIVLSLPMKNSNALSLSGVIVEILKNPLIIAVLLALPFSYFGFSLPEVVDRTGRYFANLTLPLALLTIGATLNLKSLKHTSFQAFWATATKLLILPVVLTLGAWQAGFTDQDLVIMFVLFGCPTAAASFVMAKAMGGNAQLAANIILTTTIGSVFTLSSGIYLMKILEVI